MQTHYLNHAQQRSPVLRNSFQHPAPDPAEFVNATAAPLEQKQAHDFGQSWAAASFVQDGTSHPPRAPGSSLPFADFHEWSRRSSFSLSPAKIGTNAATNAALSKGPQEKRHDPGFIENFRTCKLASPPTRFPPKAQSCLLPLNGLQCLAAGTGMRVTSLAIFA